MQQEETERFREQLEQVRQSGIGLFLEGMPSDPQTIASSCVREDQIYMADYVLDDSGLLTELRFDLITRQ